jgi:hypothetical protein
LDDPKKENCDGSGRKGEATPPSRLSFLLCQSDNDVSNVRDLLNVVRTSRA